jgi:single-strand DNA-binding protein
MLNSVCLQGRMCADSELRHTQNDIAVTSFTIANDTGYGDKKKANFIDCVAWRGTAELVCKWFSKGMQIIVEGSIQTRTYTDKDGNKRKAFEVAASNVHFAEPKRDGMAEIERNAQAAGVPVNNTDGDFVEISDPDDLPF